MPPTYDDPAKARSREFLWEAIASFLLSARDPKDIIVACFPGAEKKGEEALEVKEVYDTLGIPRGNVWGIEADPVRAKRLERAKLGIHVVPSFDYDFFAETDRRFDVISLDYTGQQTDDRLKAIRMVASRQLLSERGIMCTNFAARREPKSLQAKLALRRSRGTINEDGVYISDPVSPNRVEQLAEQLSGQKPMELGDIRDAMTMELVRIMGNGTGNTGDIDILDKCPLTGRAVELAKRMFMRPPGKLGPTVERDMDLLVSSGAFKKEELDKMLSEPSKRSHLLDSAMRSGLKAYLIRAMQDQKSRRPDERNSNCIVGLLVERDTGAYYPMQIRRAKYTSNKNMDMHMDILCLDQQRETLGKLDSILEAKTDPYGVRWRSPNNRQISLRLRDIVPVIDKAAKVVIPERTDLGSSWKAKDRITRAQAIDLLQAGCSAAEIAECYAGFKTNQLAAFKAHYVTMGKKLKGK